MDYWGRKPSLLLVSLPYFFGYLMMVYAHMIGLPALFKVVLMFGRFLTGVGIGWTSSVMPVSIASCNIKKCRVISIVLGESIALWNCCNSGNERACK